jgi:hypothetical protein
MDRFTEIEIRIEITRDCREWEWKVMFNVCIVFALDNERVLKIVMMATHQYECT